MAGGIKKAGGISFGVSMSTGQLSKDVTKARKTMGGFVSGTTKQLGGLKAALSGVGAQLAAAFSVASVGAFVRSQFNAIDALYDTSKALGVTTEALSRLNYAAELSGSSAEAVERGLAKMAKSTRDATLGLETSARAYRKLGLDAAALHKLSPEQQFLTIADAVKNLSSAQDQLTVTQDIFGRGAAELVETLRLGREGLEGMGVELDALGGTINGIDAEKINQAKDSLDKMWKAVGGLGNILAGTVAPAVTTIADGLSDWLKTIRDFKQEAGQLPEIFKYLAPTLFGAPDLGVSSQPGLPKQYLNGTNELRNPTTVNSPVAAAAAGLAPFAGVPNASNPAANMVIHGKLPGLIARGIADAIKTSAMGRNASQILGGVKDSPVAQLMRQLMGANLKQSLSRDGFKKSPIGDFDAARSGSLAAYQQRVRGSQQFSKVEEKQLAVQERIADGIDELVNIMPNWGVA